MATQGLTKEELSEVDTSSLNEASVHDCLKSTDPTPPKRSKLSGPITTRPEKMFVKAFNNDAFSINGENAIAVSSEGYIIIGELVTQISK